MFDEPAKEYIFCFAGLHIKEMSLVVLLMCYDPDDTSKVCLLSLNDLATHRSAKLR